MNPRNVIRNYEKSQKYKKTVLRYNHKNNQQNIINTSNKNTNANSDNKSIKIHPWNIISSNLKKYNATILNYKINTTNSLIFDQKIHLVAIFKDYLIWDDLSDFFKRFYFLNESIQIIPKISECYNRYSIFSPIYFGLDGLVIIIMSNWIRMKIRLLEHYIENQENKKNSFIEKQEENSSKSSFEPILKQELLSTVKSKSESNIYFSSKNTIDAFKNDVENNEKNKKNKNNDKKNKKKISMSFAELIDELSSYSTIYQEEKTKNKKVLPRKDGKKNYFNIVKKIIFSPDSNKYNSVSNKKHKVVKTNLYIKNSENKNNNFVNSKFLKISKNVRKNSKSPKFIKENKEKKDNYKKIYLNNLKPKITINNVILNNAIIENKYRALTINNLLGNKESNFPVISTIGPQTFRKNRYFNINNNNNNFYKLNKINIKNSDRTNKKKINKISNIKTDSRNSIDIKNTYLTCNRLKITKQNSTKINQTQQKKKSKNKVIEESYMRNQSLTEKYSHKNNKSINNSKNLIQLLKTSNKKSRSRNFKLISNTNNKIDFKGFNISSKLTKDNSIKSTFLNYFQKPNVINIKNIKNIINKKISPSLKSRTIRNSKENLIKLNLITKDKSREEPSYKKKGIQKMSIFRNSRNITNLIYSSNITSNNNSIQSLKNNKLNSLYYINQTTSNINDKNHSTKLSAISKKISPKKLSLNIKYNLNNQNKYRQLLLLPKKSIMFEQKNRLKKNQ